MIALLSSLVLLLAAPEGPQGLAEDEICDETSECAPGLACMAQDISCGGPDDDIDIPLTCQVPECWSDLDCASEEFCVYNYCSIFPEEEEDTKPKTLNPFS